MARSWVRPGILALALVAAGLSPAMSDAQVPPAVDPLAQQLAPPAAHASGLPGNDLERALLRYDDEEGALKSELSAIGGKLETIERRTVARGKAYYRLVRAGLLPAGGGFDALVDHAARVERTRAALERDVAEAGALRKRSGEIGARLERIGAERAPLLVHREALQRAQSALREADERRAAFARAFEATSEPPSYLAIYGADLGPSDGSRGDATQGFRALKGRLPFPIAGRAEVRKVRRPAGPGIELASAVGTPVRCVALGRVVFADRVDDYGLTVVVDHGDHFNTVYANLGTADVRAGDAVTANGRVGTVGAADATALDGGGRSSLYFEIRKGGQTVDPSPWLGL